MVLVRMRKRKESGGAAPDTAQCHRCWPLGSGCIQASCSGDWWFIPCTYVCMYVRLADTMAWTIQHRYGTFHCFLEPVLMPRYMAGSTGPAPVGAQSNEHREDSPGLRRAMESALRRAEGQCGGCVSAISRSPRSSMSRLSSCVPQPTIMPLATYIRVLRIGTARSLRFEWCLEIACQAGRIKCERCFLMSGIRLDVSNAVCT